MLLTNKKLYPGNFLLSPPGKTGKRFFLYQLPFTSETNPSFLVPVSPLTQEQKQFAPSNCITLAFSTWAGDLGVQAAYSTGMSSGQTQLFMGPGAELMLFPSSFNKLAALPDSCFGITDFAR